MERDHIPKLRGNWFVVHFTLYDHRTRDFYQEEHKLYLNGSLEKLLHLLVTEHIHFLNAERLLGAAVICNDRGNMVAHLNHTVTSIEEVLRPNREPGKETWYFFNDMFQ